MLNFSLKLFECELMSSISALSASISSLCNQSISIKARDLSSRPVGIREITMDVSQAFRECSMTILSAELKGSALSDAIYRVIHPHKEMNSRVGDIDVLISVIVPGDSLAEINYRISSITHIMAQVLRGYFPEPFRISLQDSELLLQAHQYRQIYPASMTPCVYRMGPAECSLEIGVWAYWKTKNMSQREGIFDNERLFIDLLPEKPSLRLNYASYFPHEKSIPFWCEQLEGLKDSEGIREEEITAFMAEIKSLEGFATPAHMSYIKERAISFLEVAGVPLVLAEMKQGLLFCADPKPLRDAFSRWVMKITDGYYDPTKNLESILYEDSIRGIYEEITLFLRKKESPTHQKLAIYINILFIKTAHPSILALQKIISAECRSLLEGSLKEALPSSVEATDALIPKIFMITRNMSKRFHRGEVSLRMEVYLEEHRYFLYIPLSSMPKSLI